MHDIPSGSYLNHRYCSLPGRQDVRLIDKRILAQQILVVKSRYLRRPLAHFWPFPSPLSGVIASQILHSEDAMDFRNLL